MKLRVEPVRPEPGGTSIQFASQLAEGVISKANHAGKREVLARDIDNREA